MGMFEFEVGFERFAALVEEGSHEVDRTFRSVLKRLPTDVREFVLRRCSYVAVGDDTQGQTLPPNLDWWVIVLREDERRTSVVAHEIVHAFLDHSVERRPYDPVTQADGEQERECRELVRRWGFDGLGADEPST